MNNPPSKCNFCGEAVKGKNKLLQSNKNPNIFICYECVKLATKALVKPVIKEKL